MMLESARIVSAAHHLLLSKSLFERSGAAMDVFRKRRRCFCSQSKYIDKWFESIAKSSDFYDKHATDSKIRRYFYNVDLQGRLFLEETLPKNIATSIKDDKFLNFFFSRIRLLNNDEYDFLQSVSAVNDYKFVSPCGREVNYIRPADTPIVFHSLIDGNLMYGGDLKQYFDSSRLAVSEKTGRLYHELDGFATKATQGSKASSDDGEKILCYGLIKSAVAVSLSESINPADCDSDSNWTYTTGSETNLIKWLPSAAEPSTCDWALPYIDDDE